MIKTVIVGLLAITFGVCIFLAWYFTHKAKHKERLMMIEKGMNPLDELNRDGGVKHAMFRLGVVIIGLGIGLGIIAILAECHVLGDSNAVPMSILTISGGAGLVVANRIPSNKR